MNHPATLRDRQLGLFEAAPADANVAWLESLLRNRAGWLLASDILRHMGREDTEDQKRIIRALASASPWIITGQRGYKHLEHATVEESAHAVNNLVSQGKKLITRAMVLKRNAHRRLG